MKTNIAEDFIGQFFHYTREESEVCGLELLELGLEEVSQRDPAIGNQTTEKRFQ